MLEKLPDALGHALRGQRAGLDKIAFHAVDLRAGMASITVTSLAFVDHAPIPALYTADGAGVSPPLQWLGAPGQCRLAGADRRGRRCADAATAGARDRRRSRRRRRQRRDRRGCAVEQGRRRRRRLHLGRNSYLQTGWLPPDPPPGHGVHRYAFQVFALAPARRFDGTPGRDAVLEAIREHGLASGCLIGTYERPDTSIRTPADADAAPIAQPRLAT